MDNTTIISGIDISNNTVAEFNAVDAGIAALAEKYDKEQLPDISTKDGYEFFKSGVKEVRGIIKKLEDSRKAKKSPLLAAGKVLDSEAKRIDAKLREILTPLADAKSEFDNRKQREKEERMNRAKTKIAGILTYAENLHGLSSRKISEIIDDVTKIDVSNGFWELTTEAHESKNGVLNTLADALTRQIEFERNADARKAAEQHAFVVDQISNMRQMVGDALGQPADVVQSYIDTLDGMEITEDAFGGWIGEAIEIKKETANKLEQIKAMAPDPSIQEAPETPRFAQPDKKQDPANFSELESSVIDWASKRQIFDKATPLSQIDKTEEEVQELRDGIESMNLAEIEDAIGDIIVTLIIQAHMHGLSAEQCLGFAYSQIKDRTGEMINGVFVKDLPSN